MTREQALQVLTERRNWLRERIKAKEAVRWETQWDRRECEALTVILQEAA